MFTAVHHFGISVSDMDRAIAFWGQLLGTSARDRRVVDAPFIGQLLGYPQLRIEIAWIDLPGGGALELVQHFDRAEQAYEPGTAHAGAAHVCLAVDDLDRALAHALSHGARQVSQAMVEIPGGVNKGARHVYVLDPDGVNIELRQPPPAASLKT
jgi:catechol 2,3-dioxygenase-like lactoylglutathione lyase family enzyme